MLQLHVYRSDCSIPAHGELWSSRERKLSFNNAAGTGNFVLYQRKKKNPLKERYREGYLVQEKENSVHKREKARGLLIV